MKASDLPPETTRFLQEAKVSYEDHIVELTYDHWTAGDPSFLCDNWLASTEKSCLKMKFSGQSYLKNCPTKSVCVSSCRCDGCVPFKNMKSYTNRGLILRWHYMNLIERTHDVLAMVALQGIGTYIE